MPHAKSIPDIALRARARLDGCGRLALHSDDNRVEQRPFVFEMVVESASRNPRRARDRFDPGCLKAFLCKRGAPGR